MTDPQLLVIAVVNLKGGAGKTTTAVWTAHALHERGIRPLLIDADPQRSAQRWCETAAWPLACFALPSERLQRDVPGHAAGRYDVVVIDTPGTDEGRGIARSAVKAATHVLVPTAPAAIEFERLRGLAPLLDDVTDAGHEFATGVLFNRVRHGVSSTGAYRAAATAAGWHVLDATVGLRERYSQSFGEPITEAASSEYGLAVAELLGLPALAEAST